MKYSLVLVATIYGAVTAAQAIVIDFESPYTAGSALSGQEGWGGNSSTISVESGVGEGGSAGGQFFSSLSTTFAGVNLTPSAADLGGSNSLSGQYSYSFDITINDTPAASESFQAIWSLYLGDGTSGNSARINFSDAGRVRANGGSGASYTLTQGNFSTISGVVDYDTGTFTLLADSVLIDSGTLGTSGSGALDLTMRVNGPSSAQWRQYTIDNIDIATVPEPSTIIMLGFGGLVLIWLRRCG
ncbi:MAG: PEP-CTERM sorting domain-containing protein [Verrucomicrobiota bacterium]